MKLDIISTPFGLHVHIGLATYKNVTHSRKLGELDEVVLSIKFVGDLNVEPGPRILGVIPVDISQHCLRGEMTKEEYNQVAHHKRLPAVAMSIRSSVKWRRE